MLNINDLIEDLKFDFQWQNAPEPLQDSDFQKMAKRAIRMFFSDINRPEEYNESHFITENNITYYDRTFNVNELEYIIVLIKLAFTRRIQRDLDDATSYKTDALSVTGVADAWKNLQQTINDLHNERRIRFNKMVGYTLGT